MYAKVKAETDYGAVNAEIPIRDAQDTYHGCLSILKKHESRPANISNFKEDGGFLPVCCSLKKVFLGLSQVCKIASRKQLPFWPWDFSLKDSCLTHVEKTAG
jgi:hypothetical protein